MIDRYLADVMPKKKENSKTSQIPQLRWWKERMGHTSLSNASPAAIAQLRDELLQSETRQGGPRSPSTVVRYLAALSHCFTVATKEWGWIDHNPVRNVSRPKEPRGRVRVLSDAERERLLTECRNSRNPHLYAVVVLALSTGMRRGEILDLTWDRVDFDRRVIVLMEEHTKSGEIRVIPLVGRAFDIMKDHHQGSAKDSELAFPAPPTGNDPDRPASIRTAWNRAIERAEIKDFRFHDLRHSAASYLLMSGATLGELAEILGHKTLQMVKRYSHLSEQHTSELVERMNAKVFGC